MNSGALLFLGAFFALATSFWSLVVVPQKQIGQQQQRASEVSGEQYPVGRGGFAQRGADVYRANGCAECHTQQVRPEAAGSDIERGWGKRRTVAQDYLRDYPVMLGNLRLGPDLTNIGVRQPDVLWHLRHLYNPKLTSPGSLMPPYAYLFERRKLAEGEAMSPDALPPIEGEIGYEIIPKPAALELTAYLLSLRAEVGLLEAPLPATPTNEVPGEASATNAVAGATNAADAATSAPTNPAPDSSAPPPAP